MIQMDKAIKTRDFALFAKLTCADSNQFHAVCLDTVPPIFYLNNTSHRYDYLLLLVLKSKIVHFLIKTHGSFNFLSKKFGWCIFRVNLIFLLFQNNQLYGKMESQ